MSALFVFNRRTAKAIQDPLDMLLAVPFLLLAEFMAWGVVAMFSGSIGFLIAEGIKIGLTRVNSAYEGATLPESRFTKHHPLTMAPERHSTRPLNEVIAACKPQRTGRGQSTSSASRKTNFSKSEVAKSKSSVSRTSEHSKSKMAPSKSSVSRKDEYSQSEVVLHSEALHFIRNMNAERWLVLSSEELSALYDCAGRGIDVALRAASTPELRSSLSMEYHGILAARVPPNEYSRLGLDRVQIHTRLLASAPHVLGRGGAALAEYPQWWLIIFRSNFVKAVLNDAKMRGDASQLTQYSAFVFILAGILIAARFNLRNSQRLAAE